MSKKCKDCSHWEPFDSSYKNYGECRESPPHMSGSLLMIRSNFFSDMSPVVQNQSTLWPVTEENEYCDEWTD